MPICTEWLLIGFICYLNGIKMLDILNNKIELFWHMQHSTYIPSICCMFKCMDMTSPTCARFQAEISHDVHGDAPKMFGNWINYTNVLWDYATGKLSTLWTPYWCIRFAICYLCKALCFDCMKSSYLFFISVIERWRSSIFP